MADRPYTLLSCCMSIDGYLSGPTDERLLLSNEADFDRVDALRASCDAILVGASTVRKDNPRLLVRSPGRRAERLARGVCASPTKVTVSRFGRLDAGSRFFTDGPDTTKLVYRERPPAGSSLVNAELAAVAEVIESDRPIDMHWLSRDLHERGVERLMVEGGNTLHTQFLADDLADELQITVAPFFVGDARARRFVGDGRYPWNPGRRAQLAQTQQIGDVVLLRYALSERFPTD